MFVPSFLFEKFVLDIFQPHSCTFLLNFFVCLTAWREFRTDMNGVPEGIFIELIGIIAGGVLYREFLFVELIC